MTVDRAQILRVAAAGFGRLTAPATAPMKQWQIPEDQWMRYYKPDVDKAKKLLADAGYPNGFAVKLWVIPTFPTMVTGAPVVAANLKRIGINAEIENVEYAVWIKRWLAKDFDMTMNTTPGYGDPDTAFFRALHSTKGQNWNSSSLPELDGMLEEGRRTLDPKRRKEIYDKVQIMILEKVPHLWLFSADTSTSARTTSRAGSPAPDDQPLRLRAALARQGVGRTRRPRRPWPAGPRRGARSTGGVAWLWDGSSAGSTGGAVPMPSPGR